MTLSDDDIDNILKCLKDYNIKDSSKMKDLLRNYSKNKDIIKKLNDDEILDDDNNNDEILDDDNNNNEILNDDNNNNEILDDDNNNDENNLENLSNENNFENTMLLDNDNLITNLIRCDTIDESNNNNECDNNIKCDNTIEYNNKILKNEINILDDLIKETERKIKENIKANEEAIIYESNNQRYKRESSYESRFPPKSYESRIPPKPYESRIPPKSYESRIPPKSYESRIPPKPYESRIPPKPYESRFPTKPYESRFTPRYDESRFNSRTFDPTFNLYDGYTPKGYDDLYENNYFNPYNIYNLTPEEARYSKEVYEKRLNQESYDRKFNYNPYEPNKYWTNRYNSPPIPPRPPGPPIPPLSSMGNISNKEHIRESDIDPLYGNKTIVKDYLLIPGDNNNSKLIDLISHDLLNDIDGLKDESISRNEPKYSVKSLFERFKDIKNKKMNLSKYDKDELQYYDSLEKSEKDKIDKIENKISKLNNIITPLRFRVLKSNIPLHNKAMIINKIEDLFSNKLMGGSEITKYSNWVNSLLKIPFKKYKKLPIDVINSSEKDIGNYLVDVKKTLDTAVYGHTNTKEQIIQIIAQWISNPSSTGNCIGIEGVMGNGKTTLVKNGIAKAIDRPFAFITLGGCSDSSFLEGHNYTYEGSMWGKIADILIQCKCMNPVFYFDELDKVSETPKGEEIINTLIHLTDSSQNNQFTDKYFNGVNLDLSKSLFIFSYNDKNKINPILLDRLICIKTDNFKTEDKIEIAKNYLLKDIFSQLTLDENKYKISDENLEYIIEKHTEEGGVRTLKKHLFSIFSKLNLLKLTKHDENIKYSFDLENNLLEQDEIDKKIIDSLIKDGADKDDEYYKTFYM